MTPVLLWMWLAVAAAAQQAQPSPPQATPSPAATATLTYGLVVDNTGSMREYMGDLIGAAKVFVAAHESGDEAFVVRFVSSDDIEVIREMTGDGNALGRGLDEMYVEGGQSAVIDAVYTSVEYLAKKGRADGGRRALVLLTDGEDRASYFTKEQLFTLLRKHKVPVYVLACPSKVLKARGRLVEAKALALIKGLAQESGGRAIIVEKTSELKTGAAEILKDLRHN